MNVFKKTLIDQCFPKKDMWLYLNAVGRNRKDIEK